MYHGIWMQVKEELDNVMKSIRKIHNVIDVKEEM